MVTHLISIGTELTLGQTVDTNSAWLSRELAAVGILVTRHVTMADELSQIVAVLRQAGAEADLVIVTGGLGPTLDDLTRQALAEAMGVPLEFRPEALADMEAFFRARNRIMPEANRVQAYVPQGGLMIENPTGTAPGIACRLGRAAVFVLPGVPSEMKVMFEQTVRPVLAGEGIGERGEARGEKAGKVVVRQFRHLTPALAEWTRSGAGQCIKSVTVQTYGMPESELGAKIADLMARGRNPNVGTTAKDAIIGVRINATADSPQEADRLIAADRVEVCRRLGDAVFGEGEDATLAGVVGERLIKRGLTLAVAESCTGGLVTKMLTDLPGSSAYLAEACVTYSNAAKMHRLGVSAQLLADFGAVSEPVAKAMAEGVRGTCDYALAITGIAGPGGGTAEKPVGTVHFAVASKTGPTRHAMQRFVGSREQIRDRAAKFVLNMLRLELIRGGS